MKASKGPRSNTRNIMRKKPRDRGMSPITKGMQEFEKGERVNIVIDPGVHKGVPFPRFQGLTGVVIGKRGAAFEVSIKDGNKTKTVVARPEHLVKN